MSTYPATASLPQAGSVSARYLLDEASGNAIAETGGVNLTDNGTVGAGTGYTAPGATFDNSRDFVPANGEDFTVADNSVHDLTGAFTLSLLFNPDNVSATSGLITKWSGASARGYQLFQRSDGKFTLEITSGGTSATQDAVVSGSALNNGTWYLLTAVYEPSTRMELYINGTTDAANTTSIEASVFNSATAFCIGALEGGASDNVDGQMNDVILWKGAALTDAEVLSLYNLYITAAAENNAHSFFM